MDQAQVDAAIAQHQQQIQQMQQRLEQQQAAHALELQQQQNAHHQQSWNAHNAYQAQQAQQAHAQPAQQPQHAQAPRAQSMRSAPATPFSGTVGALDEWISLMVQQFDFYSADTDAERIRYAAALLRLAALDWWQQIAVKPATWVDMVAALRVRFQSVLRAETARIAMYALKQGASSTADYVSKFRHLLGAVPTMSADDQLFQFKRGLNDVIARQLNINGVASLDLAIGMAVRVGATMPQAAAAASSSAHTEMDLSNIEGLDQETGDSASEAPVSRKEMQEMLLAAMQGRGAGSSSRAGGKGARGPWVPRDQRPLPQIAHLSPQQVKERMAAGQCFGCGATDHNSRYCPKRVMSKEGRVSWPQAN